MKRCLYSILSALSLLLLTAVVVLWVRSYWVRDSVHVRRQEGESLLVNRVVHTCPASVYFISWTDDLDRLSDFMRRSVPQQSSEWQSEPVRPNYRWDSQFRPSRPPMGVPSLCARD